MTAIRFNVYNFSKMSSESSFRNSPYCVRQQESPEFSNGTCNSNIDQESLNRMNLHHGTADKNNNSKLQTDCQESHSFDTPGNGRNSRHVNVEVRSNCTPTSFGGLFPSANDAECEQYSEPVAPGGSDVEIYRQTYMQNEYGQQHFVEVEETKQQQVVVANGQQHQQHMEATEYSQYTQYGPTLEDEQIAAEQLASELCSNYGGSNSHMISDILKRNNAQQYGYAGFQRPADIEVIQQFDNMVTNQNVIHDVDLLNTPQQLPVDEENHQGVVYRSTRHQQEQFGEPQASSTPDTYRRQRLVHPSQHFQTAVTYNDVNVHGGSWSSQNSPMFRHHHDSESPFPPARNESDTHQNHPEDYHTHLPERAVPFPHKNGTQRNHTSSGSEGRPYLSMPQFGPTPSHDNDPAIENQHIPVSDHYSGFKSPTSHNSSYGHPQHEVTKMTFTPREMMETHLSQNYRYQKKSNYGQHLSDYSSIYPSREFIERTTSQKNVKREDYDEIQKENSHPRKRSRTSKYSTEDGPKVPPQMPIFDNMFQKYAPIIPRDEVHGGKHKYFVVNPSEITNMASKSLITKYIDFLILENEQITEISKSTNPPVDIYVTEDMYFMDSIKFNAPFPSKKFVEWVASFYPRLNFFDMKFKGRQPQMPRDNKVMKPDSRPTQQILEDTFYYFQREAMNLDSDKA